MTENIYSCSHIPVNNQGIIFTSSISIFISSRISIVDKQPDLSTIVADLNQLQLDYQVLYQKNIELKNTLKKFEALDGVEIPYKEPKVSLLDKFNSTRSLLRSLLTGSAIAWFSLLFEKQFALLEDFEALLKEFEETFGDTDNSRMAANKIKKLT
ncbi:hypothetical protein F8M41_023036 [Gigaspora margarita]|uniref:Retrotransposon gag domain-containing protein n=1 Tax=Gigaspora margarita TaxID=4874 RepID=A0A8H4EHR9_GIGMA|nr:hypothetical protein F8M41_023036 [Gigaspora margarita]